jgi:hypothetical protein
MLQAEEGRRVRLIFRRSTHDADGNYKFAEKEKEMHLRGEFRDLQVGIVHFLHRDKWLSLWEVVDEVRAYEDQFRGSIDELPDMSIPEILRELACCVENGYAEAKEVL